MNNGRGGEDTASTGTSPSRRATAPSENTKRGRTGSTDTPPPLGLFHTHRSLHPGQLSCPYGRPISSAPVDTSRNYVNPSKQTTVNDRTRSLTRQSWSLKVTPEPDIKGDATGGLLSLYHSFFFVTTSKYRQACTNVQLRGRAAQRRPAPRADTLHLVAIDSRGIPPGVRCRGPGQAAGDGNLVSRASHTAPLDHNHHTTKTPRTIIAIRHRSLPGGNSQATQHIRPGGRSHQPTNQGKRGNLGTGRPHAATWRRTGRTPPSPTG